MPEIQKTSKRSENRRTRHRQIIEAARGLYRDAGPENATMEQIARSAGCTRRTLYSYFQSWDDVCLHVFLEDLENRWAFQLEHMGDCQGVDRLRAWAETYMEYALKYPHTLRLQFFWDYRGIHADRISADSLQRLDEVVAPLVKDLGQAMRQGQAEGTIRRDLEVEATLGQFAYSLRAALNRALFPAESFTTVDPRPFVAGFIDLFIRGIVTHV